MAEITAEYEGILEKFIGDAVIVFFGDPRSSGVEKDATRCVRMANEMKNAVF